MSQPDRTSPPAQLYRTVRLIRRFEERAIDLVRAGVVDGIHPCIGQEGVAAGVCAALRADDVLFSNHRSHGHLLAKGSDPARLLAEIAGRANGVDRGRGGSLHLSDFDAGVYGATITVGHTAGMAAGVAWAAVRNGTGQVVVSVVGDGAMTQGALLEGLNLAALWRLPVVFVCEHNGYATTMPADQALAGTIQGRGAAFGIPSTTVDGQDPQAVLTAAEAAVAMARAGDGPSLLECRTYRYEGHHTFELKARVRYRDAAEVSGWRERDPVDIQAARIAAADRAQLDAEVEAVLDAAERFAVDGPRPDPAGALDGVYAPASQPVDAVGMDAVGTVG